MNRLTELFEKLKLRAGETKRLDEGAAENIITALQENNGEESFCRV